MVVHTDTSEEYATSIFRFEVNRMKILLWIYRDLTVLAWYPLEALQVVTTRTQAERKYFLIQRDCPTNKPTNYLSYQSFTDH